MLLGAVQGPTELLPVSSSGHLVLLPALLRSPYTRLHPELRKEFEVALHAGTAAALVVALRGEVAEVVRDLDARRLLRVGLSGAPAAVAALLLERVVEERLSSVPIVAAAQVIGAAGLWMADRRPESRGREDAGVLDHLVVGAAQALALVPGVSRNGATLTAARLRGFSRPAASRLSRHAALPVILGAGVLKGTRLARRGLARELAVPFAAGAAAAACSTLAARPLMGWMDSARGYAPVAAYRVALGSAAAMLAAPAGRPRTVDRLRRHEGVAARCARIAP